MRLEVRSYEPLPKQREFHESDAFLRLYQGGFGAGKTLAGVWEAIDVSMAYPNNFGIVARKTYRELEDSTKKTFFEVCPKELIGGFRARDDVVTFVNGSRIAFRSLDDPDKLRSTNLGWFYVDEASEIEDEDIPTMLVGRLRLDRVPWRGGWFTSNPATVEHWTYKWFVERAKEAPHRYHMVVASSYENPYLPREYIEALEQEYSPSWVRRYLRGEFGFVAKGTAVFENFNESLHVVDKLEPLPDRPIIRAWDFGFHHPAVLWSQIGPNGVLRVLRELMGTDILISKFADQVIAVSKEKFPPDATFIDVGDPAGGQRGDKDPRTSVDILRERGIRVATRKYPKKRLIELVEAKLGQVRKQGDSVQPVILISRQGCPVLIEGLMGGYCWPKAKDGKISRETPLEDGYYEHLQDCLQYTAAHVWLGGAAATHGPVTIREARWRFS